MAIKTPSLIKDPTIPRQKITIPTEVKSETEIDPIYKEYAEYLTKKNLSPSAPITAGDVAGAVGEQFGKGDWLGGIGTGLAKGIEYLATPEGMRVSTLFGQNDPYYKSAVMDIAKGEEAEYAARQKAARDAEQARMAQIGKVYEQGITEEGLGKRQTQQIEATKSLEQEKAKAAIETERIKNIHAKELKDMELRSTEQQKALDRQQAVDFKRIDQTLEAGKFDETSRQELIKMVAGKDPKLALELSGMNIEEIQRAKLNNPAWYSRLGQMLTLGIYRPETSATVATLPKGKGTPQYEAAMQKKGMGVARK